MYFKMRKKRKNSVKSCNICNDVDHRSASVIIHELQTFGSKCRDLFEVPLQAAGYSAGLPLYEGGNPSYIVTCSLIR